MKVSLESYVAVPVGSTEHETAKKFIMNQFDGGHMFGIRGSSGAPGNFPGCRKLFEFCSQEGRSNADCTDASIRLEGFYLGCQLLSNSSVITVIGVAYMPPE